jgi:hypothetical protein
MLYEMVYIVLSVPDYSEAFLNFDAQAWDEQMDDTERKNMADAASVLDAILAAVLVFVYAVLRGIPRNARIFGLLLARLRGAIQRPNVCVLGIWKGVKNENVLLWVCGVACCVAEGGEREWWVGRLAEVCGDLGVVSREELEGRLRCIAWTDGDFGGGLEGIWDEMLSLQRRDEAGQMWTCIVDRKGHDMSLGFEDGRWMVDDWCVCCGLSS